MRRVLIQRLLPLMILAAATAWTVLPVLSNIGSHLPIRENHLTTVPMFNAWTIWWNADRARHGFAGYWDAPIFFPEHNTFAFSEPQPATVVVAPVIWLTESPASAYNVYLLLSLFLNGAVTWLVLRRNRTSRCIAIIGAIMMVWLPLSVREIEVLQLVPVWTLLWTWDAVRRHGRSPSLRTAVESSLAFTLSFYSSIHHTLFLSIVLPGTAWILFSSFRTRRFWQASALAALLTGILVGLVFVPMRQTLDHDEFERDRDLVSQLSAKTSDFFVLPDDVLLSRTHWNGFRLSPGWLKLNLAGMGVALGLCRRRKRRWTLFLLLTVGLSALLALGPNLKIGTFQPWWTLAEWCPGISQVRNVYRFAYLTQMAVILLNVVALSEIAVRLRVRFQRPWRTGFAVCAIGCLAVAEVPAPRTLVAGVPDLARHHGWTEFVRQQTPPGKGIACLPFAASTKGADFDVTTRWMYFGTLHGVPLVNGYSGFFPEAYMDLRDEITENGLTAETLSLLAQQKTHFLVVRQGYVMPAPLDSGLGSYQLRLLFEDPVGIDVYQLVDVTR